MSTGSNVLSDDGFFTPEELHEIRQTFFDQGRVALASLGQQILALEGHILTEASLRSARRAAHTLKSDCASVGFPDLSSLAHALEDVFSALELRGRRLSADESDRLLAAVDLLTAGLEAGAAGRPGPDIGSFLPRLRALCGGPAATSGLALVDEYRARLDELQGQGLAGVLLRIRFAPDVRRRARVVEELLGRLPLELVAQHPTRRLAQAEAVDILAASAQSPAALLALVGEAMPGVAVAIDSLAQADPLPVGPVDAPREGETIRVEARRVDEVLNLIGELVTARSAIAGVAADIEPGLAEEQASRLADAQALLARVLQDLQRSAMRMRMVPVGRVFRRFTRVVRDVARRTRKNLTLQIEGESTELDRGVLDALEEPLLHLVRNAVDHGIESAEERKAAGKPESGALALRASREGNQILIEVIDDGRGIDAEAVRRTAQARGLIAEADVLTPDDVLQLIFQPGFSTAAAVTETSGRGVGLAVVRETVDALRGSVTASNLPEGGSSFVIRVPLTVAIIQALLFKVGDRELAVPLAAVVEIARLADLSIQSVGDHEIFRLRDGALGLVRLASQLGLTPGGEGFVLVLQCSSGRYGIAVDSLIGEEELVIKAVHDQWIRTPLVAGASVVGGGVVVLILDVLAVYRAALGRGALLHA